MEVRIERFAIAQDSARCVLIADASDLGLGHGQEFHRIYPDACDVGLTVIGRSGPVDFVMAPLRDSETLELYAWEGKPTPESLGRVPSAAGCRCRIYND